MERWKPSNAIRGLVYALESYQWCGESYFAGAAISYDMCLPRNPKRDRLGSI